MKSVLCRLVKALSIKKLLSVVKFRPGKNSNWEKISQFEFFPGLNLTTENNYYAYKINSQELGYNFLPYYEELQKESTILKDVLLNSFAFY